MKNPLLTQEELAAMMKVKVHTVAKWRKKFRLPYVVLGKRIYFNPSTVKDWMKQSIERTWTQRRGSRQTLPPPVPTREDSPVFR